MGILTGSYVIWPKAATFRSQGRASGVQGMLTRRNGSQRGSREQGSRAGSGGAGVVEPVPVKGGAGEGGAVQCADQLTELPSPPCRASGAGCAS